MDFDIHRRTACAVDPVASILAVVRDLLGLPADHRTGGLLITSIEQAGLCIPTLERLVGGTGVDIALGRFASNVAYQHLGKLIFRHLGCQLASVGFRARNVKLEHQLQQNQMFTQVVDDPGGLQPDLVRTDHRLERIFLR